LRRKLNFSQKLALGLAGLSVAGLVVIFTIVNTIVRDIIYDNIIGIAQRDMVLYADEIEDSFIAAGQTVLSLATVLNTLSSEYYFPAITERFVEEYEFVENAFIGFADGSIINGTGWIPTNVGTELDGIGWGPWENWSSTDRPWFSAAKAVAPGEIGITTAYISDSIGNVTLAMCTWLPELGGVGAVVGFSVAIENYLLDMISEHLVTSDGYLILLGARER